MKNINTYNESSLHLTLKKLYSLNEGDRTEVVLDGHIYDIVTKDQDVIEIQTKNIYSLKEKILDSLSKDRNVKIVHPIPCIKIIQTKDKEGNIISCRKSPKKLSIYSVFNEIKSFFPILLMENFCLELIICEITEERVRTEEKEQSKNKRRRFKKNWQIVNKKLDKIIETKTFKTQQDYLSLLPENLPAEFCVNDIKNAFKIDKTKNADCIKNANIMIWTFSKMGIIEFIGKKGNSKIYRISK